MFGQVIRFVLVVRVQFFRRGALQNSLQNIGVIAAPSLQQLHISLLFMLPVVCLFIINNLRLIPTGTICCYGRLESNAFGGPSMFLTNHFEINLLQFVQIVGRQDKRRAISGV